MWVALRVERKIALYVSGQGPITLPLSKGQCDAGSIGYLPVFETRAAAEAWAGEAGVFEIAIARAEVVAPTETSQEARSGAEEDDGVPTATTSADGPGRAATRRRKGVRASGD